MNQDESDYLSSRTIVCAKATALCDQFIDFIIFLKTFQLGFMSIHVHKSC